MIVHIYITPHHHRDHDTSGIWPINISHDYNFNGQFVFPMAKVVGDNILGLAKRYTM